MHPLQLNESNKVSTTILLLLRRQNNALRLLFPLKQELVPKVHTQGGGKGIVGNGPKRAEISVNRLTLFRAQLLALYQGAPYYSLSVSREQVTSYFMHFPHNSSITKTIIHETEATKQWLTLNDKCRTTV